jgi:hypothetical protein
MRVWPSLEPIPCRVCGLEFASSRFDAVTCSATCRQRLHRGGGLAYLADLPPEEQRLHRDLHNALDASREAEKKAIAARMQAHKACRKAKRVRIENSIRVRLKLDDLLKILVQPNSSDEVAEERAHDRALGSVAAVLKLFVKEKRNDFSPAVLAAFLNAPLFTPEKVAELVKLLRASGDYDRILRRN